MRPFDYFSIDNQIPLLTSLVLIQNDFKTVHCLFKFYMTHLRYSSPPPSPRTMRSPKAQWRKVAGQLRATLPKLAAFMAEADVLAYMTFPTDHWQKIYSTNGLEGLNGEFKRRTEVVGIL